MSPAQADSTTDKVTEDRLRRAATRQGWTMHKSRSRDPRALDYGTYRLEPTAERRARYPLGPPGVTCITLDDVAQYLNDPGNH